ncbi:transmembrane protein, putative [Bodo saltans]|uniref:Transmembrane protein, putative n=1 Tax=Bodo saltans TaxID=75058 RepID=A0A0S4IQM3_BODSA|nr:transmembrane protein, putative [Bodo saltans]|eukprot:CUF24827.1 transmembrane protein, putative [Bodo saltans]
MHSPSASEPPSSSHSSPVGPSPSRVAAATPPREDNSDRGGSDDEQYSRSPPSSRGSSPATLPKPQKHVTYANSPSDDDSHALHEPQKTSTYDEMNKVVSQDPRQIIEGMIVESGQISIPFDEIERDLRWSELYEDFYGTIHEYLQSYQAIFVVSPIADSVALRSQMTTVNKGRRSTKPQRRQVMSRQVGSVSYCSIAESFELAGLEQLYRNRGYSVIRNDEMLQVTSPGCLDLFVLANGVVVWWGADRPNHWVVDDDFLTDTSTVNQKYASERHWQADIDELFPTWCTFEYDSMSVDKSAVDEAALLRFNEKLCFDHYLIPSEEPMRSQVMMAVSFSLGRAAKVDYLEHVTRASQKAVLDVPSDVHSLMDYFSAHKKIAKLEGELRITSMTITTLHDTPEFLWEMPYLRGYFVMAENQNSVEARRDWFLARADALFEKLKSIQARRHRLFMMSSDVFLIVLLVLDVVAMLMRLSMAMYFPREHHFN